VTYSYQEQLIESLKELSAEQLMVIYQQNSPEEAFEAFNELYFRFSHKVFSFIQKKVRNQADAEDILQKVFIKIHESKHLYKIKFKFEQWIFIIARSAVMDFFRARSRYDNRIAKTESLTEKTETLEAENFNSLSEDQKELLELKFIDELTYQEMSALLQKSEPSIRKMVSRIMINLRKGDV
jgi:RNA polymerase sigma factor (sigma-70 family)